MNLKSPINRLRLLAVLEGISFLLFGITMPMKYMLDIPGPNYIVGMAHGLLFILYGVICLQCIFKYRFTYIEAMLSLAASLIPFGTFVADAKLFKPVAMEANNEPFEG